MCRHLAYLGPPTTLAALLLDPPHGLLRQSYAPADMRGGGTVNADGFGAGWYPAGSANGSGSGIDVAPAGEVARYRSDRPMWADTGFAALAAGTSAGAVLAAVRSATVGMPVTVTAAAPFAEGRWLFSHNGLIRGWPGSMAGLAEELPVTDLLTLDAPTDSALLWALVRHRLRAGAGPAAVLAGVVDAVAAAAPRSRLNLLLTDGTAIWATTWTHTLSVLVEPGAVTVASEPTDPGAGWTAVPEGHLVVATVQQCDVRPLHGGASAATSATSAAAAARAPAAQVDQPAAAAHTDHAAADHAAADHAAADRVAAGRAADDHIAAADHAAAVDHATGAA